MITQDELNKLFTYEPSTGNLIRKVGVNGTQVGDVAGYKKTNGYVSITINSKKCMAHRLIWVLVHGSIDSKLQIDHINGVKDDNRLSNIRLVTQQENLKNKRIGKSNKSGAVGVSWYKKTLKWCAKINVNGKMRHLGYFTNKDEAIAARKAASIKHGFHSNHGVT